GLTTAAGRGVELVEDFLATGAVKRTELAAGAVVTVVGEGSGLTSVCTLAVGGSAAGEGVATELTVAALGECGRRKRPAKKAVARSATVAATATDPHIVRRENMGTDFAADTVTGTASSELDTAALIPLFVSRTNLFRSAISSPACW